MNKLGFVAGLSLAVMGCIADDGQDGAAGAAGPEGAIGAQGPAGPPGPQLALPALYTLSNASAGNQVSSYLRSSNGNLSRAGAYATKGTGTDAGLGSQGALVFDQGTQRFFAANAGDDTISMLSIDAGGDLTVLSTVKSGGKRPVSITVFGDTVYVANQGTLGGAQVDANISGFQIKGNDLVPLAGSTRPLSATNDVRPTDIEFTPDGAFLIVAERFSHKLGSFKVENRIAQPGNFQNSAGMQPFAFDFSPEGNLVVAEVGDGSRSGSSVSSYTISDNGVLTSVTSALPTKQGAACWLVMVGGYAYIANAATANITGVTVSEAGALTLHDENGITGVTGAGAIDLAVSPDRGYLYSLSNGPHTITPFAIHADGSLTAMPALPGVPTAAAGLVAR